MKLETNIEKIKQSSQENEAENFGFRSFLKSSEVASKKVDLIVQRLNRNVTEQIDCRECGSCCKEVKPVIKAKDISALAKHLKLSEEDFKKKYLEVDGENEDKYTFNAQPCPFLEENSCSVYNARPEDCRSYPHLHKKRFVSRTISVINNCAICPIVYNVYEQLKKEIWEMGDLDDFY